MNCRACKTTPSGKCGRHEPETPHTRRMRLYDEAMKPVVARMLRDYIETSERTRQFLVRRGIVKP